MPTTVANLTELDTITSRDAGKLTVIDFYADWCGPCRTIAPKYEALSKQYTNVNFLKCNVDNSQDVARKYGVSAMPTFVFLKGGSVVHTVRGANPRALDDALKTYSEGSSGGAFSGKGQRLGGPSDSTSTNETPAVDNLNLGPLANMSPQAKILALLVAAYVVLMFFKS